MINRRGMSGQALISAMVLVVLLGILSINGFRASLLEQRTTVAEREHAIVFQDAENALMFAEQNLPDLSAESIGTQSRLWQPISVAVPASWEASVDQDEQVRRVPEATVRLLSRGGSLVVGGGAGSPTLAADWVQVDVTAFNQFDSPSIRLRSILKRGAD